MRLGKIQKAIVDCLKSRGAVGLIIWAGSEIPGLEGYFVDEILPSVERLIARGVVMRVGDNGRIILAEPEP